MDLPLGTASQDPEANVWVFQVEISWGANMERHSLQRARAAGSLVLCLTWARAWGCRPWQGGGHGSGVDTQGPIPAPPSGPCEHRLLA